MIFHFSFNLELSIQCMMQSFEPSENWVPTLHLGEMHVQTPQIITCANRYFLGCCMFVHANNSLPKPMALSVHLCPHCKFLHFLSKTKVKTASCMCRAHTCLTGVMWQTQTPEPLACLEELLSLWREDSLLPVWRWRHSASVAEWSFRGLIFGGAQCTAQYLIPEAPARQTSKCWLVCTMERQSLVPSGSLPDHRHEPQLQHSVHVGCPAGCCQLSLSAGSHPCKVRDVGPLFSSGHCLRISVIAVVY